jgi:predicted permease
MRTKIWNRIRRWVGRSRFEADLAEEIRFHREMEREHHAAGGDPRQFGSEVLALEQSREVWGFGWFDSITQDIRYAVRGLARTPGFALTVIGTIGLGLGINTALFTAFNTYVLHPIAIHDPYGLYEFWWQGKDSSWRATQQQFQALRAQNNVFLDIAAYEPVEAPLDGRPANGEYVSGNYFELVGPRAHIGRLIEADDPSDVAVLSYDAWTNLYGADPNILNRKVRNRGRTLQVIGVAKPGFSGIGPTTLDFWAKAAEGRAGEGPRMVRLIGRLHPGVSPQAARSAVLAWAQADTAGLPAERRAITAQIVSRATPIELSPELLAAMSPIFAGFGLVLAIACANVSNLMLARALSRQREMAIRVSLGAGRGRLIRQLLTESLLLAIPAAFTGILVSHLAMQFGVWLLFQVLPPAFTAMVRVPTFATDWRVFAFVLLAAAGAAVLFGLVPALQTTRSRIVEASRGDFSMDHRPSRLRSVLVAVQVTVCALLTICSVVALRSQQRVSGRDIRIRTQGVFHLVLSKKLSQFEAERLRSSPGIEAVAAVWRPPIYQRLVKLAVIPSGSAVNGSEVLAGYNFVTPEYFDLLRIPVVRGRVFTAEEARGGSSNVVVISESTARLLWPNSDALGATLQIPAKRQQADRRSNRMPPFTSARVIGIVGDVATSYGSTAVDASCLYFPTTIDHQPEGQALFASVTAPDGGGGGRRDLIAALEQIGPDLADQINALSDVHELMQFPFRIVFWVAGSLAFLSMVLTVSGIYGVLSFVVTQRVKEIGIRMALGAGRGAVIRMVVVQCMRLVGIGSGVGAGIALMIAPLFANLIEAVQPYDAVAYLSAGGLIAVAALAASMRPAQKAARVDPLISLRCD